MRAAVLALILTASPVGAADILALRDDATGETVILTDQRGACPEGTLAARWVSGKLTVPGCYIERHGRYWILYADGDKGVIAKGSMKPVGL